MQFKRNLEKSPNERRTSKKNHRERVFNIIYQHVNDGGYFAVSEIHHQGGLFYRLKEA